MIEKYTRRCANRFNIKNCPESIWDNLTGVAIGKAEDLGLYLFSTFEVSANGHIYRQKAYGLKNWKLVEMHNLFAGNFPDEITFGEVKVLIDQAEAELDGES